MKKYIFTLMLTMFTLNVHAACAPEDKTYIHCNPGYYLSGTSCVECPTSSDGATVTSPDENTEGENYCYIVSGSEFSDATGSGTYSNDCYYGACGAIRAVCSTTSATSVGNLGSPVSGGGAYCWCCVGTKCAMNSNYTSSGGSSTCMAACPLSCKAVRTSTSSAVYKALGCGG